MRSLIEIETERDKMIRDIESLRKHGLFEQALVLQGALFGLEWAMGFEYTAHDVLNQIKAIKK